MIKDKEYPATHSMSTAWYVADKDGNVAIINFEDNGPVPWGTEETDLEYLVFGHEEKTTEVQIALTDDQIDELIENPHSPEEENMWYEYCVVQIDTTKEQEFLQLNGREDFTIEHCLSKRRGLYKIDAFSSYDMHSNNIIEGSSLQKLIDNKIIVKVYTMKDLYIRNIWSRDHVVYAKKFDNIPYFVYAQPYCNDFLPERLNVPSNPIKLHQLPEDLRKRVPILPIRFCEQKNFQIAEWVPCIVSRDVVEVVNGCEYSLLPLTNGTESFVLTELDAGDFMDYCSEKENYHCTECRLAGNCHTFFSYQRTIRPTVVFIYSPFEEVDYEDKIKADVIFQNAVWLSFLNRVPYKTESYCNNRELKEMVRLPKLKELYLKNYRYLEDRIALFKPHVLILDDVSYDVLSQQYLVEGQNIIIRDIAYPFYMRNDIEKCRTEIEVLAQKPYRGEILPYIITKEEMSKLKSRTYD